MENNMILTCEGVTKRFSETVALDNVRFSLKRGEVHALMGENGAGKSTLGKIFSGIHQPDRGDIYLKGEKITLPNPRVAKENGIFTVFQEFNLLPDLSVAENLFIGDDEYYRHRIFLDKKKMFRDARKLLNTFELGANIDVHELVANLTVAQMQVLEILKAVDARSEVIILDEPTAALSANEVDQLFKMIRRLKAEQNVAFIIVSHRIEEIFEIGDRVTILRDGKLIVDGANLDELTEDDLVLSMVGREIKDLYGSRPAGVEGAGEVVLEINNLSDTADRVKDVSLQLRSGEILGLTGLVGAGRTELVRCVMGIDPLKSGRIKVKGEEITKPHIRNMIERGIVYVTEDRKYDGLILNMAIAHNVSLAKQTVDKRAFIDKQSEVDDAELMRQSLKIRMAHCSDACESLSGGNQQKVLLGKWLVTNPDILIIDEPTRGVDIAAKSEIYAVINRLAAEGKAILMISSEQQEIIGLCDRALVMRDGRVTGEIMRESLSEERITKLATIG